ncbi:hypothetical protein [Clostridium arbusti]|uniref:hypothetical protein n=1 Tax=Clostridium arbusti TaxID=1137848 RepID=UPI0002EC5247|nr:hypothetical protein [Clostridium arbusti]
MEALKKIELWKMTVTEWHDSDIGGRVVDALKKNGFEAVYLDAASANGLIGGESYASSRD